MPGCATGIPHEQIAVATPFAGPKGKAPWIEEDGRKLGDSSFIVAHLAERFGVAPDAHLTPTQRGVAVAIQRLIDENLGCRDVNALSAILGDSAWFCGDTPSTTDAVVYAQLVNFWRAPLESKPAAPSARRPALSRSSTGSPRVPTRERRRRPRCLERLDESVSRP